MCIIHCRAFHNGDGCGTCARRGRCRPDFGIVCAPTSRTTGPREPDKKKTQRQQSFDRARDNPSSCHWSSYSCTLSSPPPPPNSTRPTVCWTWPRPRSRWHRTTRSRWACRRRFIFSVRFVGDRLLRTVLVVSFALYARIFFFFHYLETTKIITRII